MSQSPKIWNVTYLVEVQHSEKKRLQLKNSDLHRKGLPLFFRPFEA